MKLISLSKTTVSLFLPFFLTILILIMGSTLTGDLFQMAEAQRFGRRRFGPRSYGYTNPVDHRRGSRFRSSRFLRV